MSKAKMVVPANLSGVQVPEGYMLVQQIKSVPSNASNSKVPPTYGKNWNRNQRKRERRAMLTAGGNQEPARNPWAESPPATVETGTMPAAVQSMSPATAEAGPSSYSGSELEKCDVVVESTTNHPGYHTASYAQHRADKLAVMNKNGLSAEALLKQVVKLLNYLYGC